MVLGRRNICFVRAKHKPETSPQLIRSTYVFIKNIFIVSGLEIFSLSYTSVMQVSNKLEVNEKYEQEKVG